MKHRRRSVTVVVLVLLAAAVAFSADQTVPGAGNAHAVALARQSPMVQSAYQFLQSQAARITDPQLRQQTLDALANPQTCVAHRAHLTDAQKNAIVATLEAQGLLNQADAASLVGGAKAGVFPPVLDDGTACPHLPQPFFAAPGSAFVHGHHSYPGGLPVHESNNEVADVHLATEYREIYGHRGRGEFPTVSAGDGEGGDGRGQDLTDIDINQDIIVAAPLWHDWAKSLVFQWNSDGTEFTELNFGGTGTNDNYGAKGDSRTGAHHVITIAEGMSRGLSPELVITMACAHSAPTNGNEFKVVNWLRAAAIMARIDPVAKGYLYVDGAGKLRLPPLRHLGDVNLNAAGQTNVLAEYTIHNLSDADYTYSGAAVDAADLLLKHIASQFGYKPMDANYLNKFRNPVISFLTGERLLILYSQKGLQGVVSEVQELRKKGVI